MSGNVSKKSKRIYDEKERNLIEENAVRRVANSPLQFLVRKFVGNDPGADNSVSKDNGNVIFIRNREQKGNGIDVTVFPEGISKKEQIYNY